MKRIVLSLTTVILLSGCGSNAETNTVNVGHNTKLLEYEKCLDFYIQYSNAVTGEFNLFGTSSDTRYRFNQQIPYKGIVILCRDYRP